MVVGSPCGDGGVAWLDAGASLVRLLDVGTMQPPLCGRQTAPPRALWLGVFLIFVSMFAGARLAP